MIIAVLSSATSFEKKYIIQQNLYDFLGKKYNVGIFLLISSTTGIYFPFKSQYFSPL